MGADTSTHALPYPVGTDRVADGDNAMQALAESVDGLLPITKLATGTVDGSGFATITHGLGKTPKGVFCTVNAATGGLWAFFTDNYTGTTVRIRATDGTGAPAPGGTVVNLRMTYFLT